MGGIGVVNLATYTSPKVVEVRNQDWINYGQDNNGNYLAVGMTRGCDVNGTISTGVALGDLNGYSLTITGQEPLMAQFITANLVTTKIAGGATPTQITPA